tara:strand:+ start:56 stop:556 length:501 start_codon:yes stop_codon:yes gene_type:complete
MAGRPQKRKILADLEKLGGPQYIADHIIGGGSISGKAKELGYDPGTFLRVLTKAPEYKRAIDDVREIAAEYHAEAGSNIMRELRAERVQERANAEPGDKLSEISQIDVSIARERAQQHRFIAEAWSNRYNKRSDTNITLNVGDLYLDALKKAKDVTPAAEVIEHDE